MQPEHLLRALLEQPECTAVLLLERLGPSLAGMRTAAEQALQRGGAGPQGDDVWLSPDTCRVLREAGEEAAFAADDCVGTEHLLLVLARGEDRPAGRLLAERGADFSTLRQESGRLRRDEMLEGITIRVSGDRAVSPPPGSRPRGVGLAAGMFLLHTCCLACTPIACGSVITGTTWWETAWWAWCFIGASLWYSITGLAIGSGLLSRHRFAWIAAEAILLVRSAASCAAGALVCVLWSRDVWTLGGGSNAWGWVCSLAICIPYPAALITCAWLLFRAAEWYGIDPRRRWQTLRREGWPVLAAATLLEGGMILGTSLLSASGR